MANNIVLLLVAVLALVLLFGLGGTVVGSTGLIVGLIINSLIGIIILYVLNLLGIHIPINIITVLIVVLLGLAGIALLAILALLGIYGSETIA